ncbi:putative transcriptional regulator [Salinihabitans flavidus]|uniref:UPF0301 protein SAMN04490248_11134 n=1 Tax=Salinihabitans flavidus TaxID=569882 RepID=A0A1H8S7U9_9RHOB|nr:YqgE/AlgH family protein [Salinihabitans flavidus]SEO74705.1 putative transcriptional regulator [Salinihabitans flavidus]
MQDDKEALDLSGKMLIAMPGMGDPRFANAVVFLCAYSDDGAMGLIVNKPVEDMRLSDLLEQLSIEQSDPRGNIGLHFGGPVEGGRGFVLHSPDYRSELSTMAVSEGFAMTATLDILEEMARGAGPDRALMALGYAGWGPGQIEAEIAANGWLVCDPTQTMVFDLPDADKWTAALRSIGVDALTLSSSAGHA